MTKYILVGGYPKRAIDNGKSFAEELVRGFDEPVEILDCLFARPKDTWEKAYTEDVEFFTGHLPDKQLNIEMALPEIFIEQVRRANAIYIRGGEAERLTIELLKATDLKSELEGKTLAGSSAGADVISKYFYGLDDLKLYEGLGFLSLKVIVHWQSDYNAPNIDWDKAYKELDSFKESLPILALKEGEFKVFEN